MTQKKLVGCDPSEWAAGILEACLDLKVIQPGCVDGNEQEHSICAGTCPVAQRRSCGAKDRPCPCPKLCLWLLSSSKALQEERCQCKVRYGEIPRQQRGSHLRHASKAWSITCQESSVGTYSPGSSGTGMCVLSSSSVSS